MLISIQYARAVAALLVVFAHLSGFQLFAPLSFGEFGGMGVDIFFVISGFIMWETSRGQSARNFATRRISRIVPAYWFYTTLLVALALLVPKAAPRVLIDLPAVIKTYLFIPYVDHLGHTNPILLQGWTLNYEMYFYVVFTFALFLGSRAAQFSLISAFFLACAAIGYFVTEESPVLAFYTSTMPIEFVFGMLVSIASRTIVVEPISRVACLLLGAGALFGIGIYNTAAEPRFLAFGVPSALIIFGLVGLEGFFRRRPWKLLALIGDASYSLYLSHPFVLSAVAILVAWTNARLFALSATAGALLFGFVAVVLSVIFACLSYILFEKPVGRFLNSMFQGATVSSSRRPVASPES